MPGAAESTVVPDTKHRLLDAAEALFAQYGIADTSMRAITARAGVNLAAVNYHFGSKDKLVEAVIERRLAPMNRARLERLKALEVRHGATPPLDALVRAFVAPALELSRDRDGGNRFVRLLGQAYTKPSAKIQGILRGMYEEVIARFKPAFAHALPHIPKDELYWRMHFMVGLLAYCMAGSEMMQLIASCRVDERGETELMTVRLVGFVTAGLQAPVADAGPPDADAETQRTAPRGATHSKEEDSWLG